MEMIPSIDVNLTKIDERQMTLMTSIDIKWLELTSNDSKWRQNCWRVNDNALWRQWRLLTFIDVFLSFYDHFNFWKIWKKIFWRFKTILWRFLTLPSILVPSLDIKWRQLSSKLVFDVKFDTYFIFWRFLTAFDAFWHFLKNLSKIVKNKKLL